ncbi:ATP-binding cassette domain-containing protein, partial [Streptococcus suis]
MPLLDVQHVQKIYSSRFKAGQVEALKDIHFTVEKGEYVAIMGESGSGKS